jgi:hypothetical protein
MISTLKSATTATRSKSKWPRFAPLATLLVLTGCATSTQTAQEQQRQLFQPLTLSLKAGQPIQTQQGLYTPQVDELWYSPSEMKKADDEILDLTTQTEINRQNSSK